MLKINLLLLTLFALSHCSIDTKTGLWENKKSIKDERKVSEIVFDKELSFDDFKKNVVLYGKKSNYPSIMEK